MLNNWSGQGRLAKDIELRYTANQIPVASFSIACDRDFKPKDGGDRETDWIDIVAWNKSAEFAHKYFRKGDMMIVSGRLQTRTYEDQNGSKRKVTEVVATSINFGGSKRQDGDQQYGGGQYGNYQQNNQYAQQNGQYAQQSGQYGQQGGYGGQQQYGNPYGGGGQSNPDPLAGFMSIPDGIDEDLPFT